MAETPTAVSLDQVQIKFYQLYVGLREGSPTPGVDCWFVLLVPFIICIIPFSLPLAGAILTLIASLFMVASTGLLKLVVASYGMTQAKTN
jgi:hypothetical protein